MRVPTDVCITWDGLYNEQEGLGTPSDALGLPGELVSTQPAMHALRICLCCAIKNNVQVVGFSWAQFHSCSSTGTHGVPTFCSFLPDMVREDFCGIVNSVSVYFVLKCVWQLECQVHGTG